MRKPIVSVEVEQGEIFVNTVNVIVMNEHLIRIDVDSRAKRYAALIGDGLYLYANRGTLRSEKIKDPTVVRYKVNRPGKWHEMPVEDPGKYVVRVYLYRLRRRTADYTQVWSSQ